MDFPIYLFFCLGILSVGAVSETLPCPYEDLTCYFGSYQIVVENWAENQTGCAMNNTACQWNTCSPSVCNSALAIAIFRSYQEIKACDVAFEPIATEMKNKCLDCCSTCDIQNYQKTQRTCTIEYSDANNILQSILIACTVIVVIEFISFRSTKNNYKNNYMPIYTNKKNISDSLF